MGRRVADEVAFFAALQRRFYASMAAFYREDLGCKQLINASNWRTADAAKLEDLERWSVHGDRRDRHRTATTTAARTPAPEQPGGSTRATTSPRSRPWSTPGRPPLNIRQVVGHPMLVTEGSWVVPLAFQAEGPFLAAVYQSLTGVDGFYWFTMSKPEYDDVAPLPLRRRSGASSRCSSSRPRSRRSWAASRPRPCCSARGTSSRGSRSSTRSGRSSRSATARPRSSSRTPRSTPTATGGWPSGQGRRPGDLGGRPARVPRRAGRGEVRRRPERRPGSPTWPATSTATRRRSGA